MTARHVQLIFVACALAIGLLAGCGGTLDAPACVRPPQSFARVCPVVPRQVFDNGDATSTCTDIVVPPEGCLAWNGAAVEGFCVPVCP